MNAVTICINTGIKALCRTFCRIDDSQLERVPHHGPLILVGNHINFLEVPLMYTHLMPRPITGFAKIETWKNPFLGYLFDLWGAIPLRRGEADVAAIRRALEALEQGKIIGIAPEGTRSRNGRLGKAHPGVVILALRSRAPILPVVYFGGENFETNIKRLRRTDFNIRVGNPFYVHVDSAKATSEVRQQIADEIMYQLAALLPPEYRGYYANLEKASEKYLRFPPNSRSNLLIAASG